MLVGSLDCRVEPKCVGSCDLNSRWHSCVGMGKKFEPWK
jgi:hypothetical protein